MKFYILEKDYLGILKKDKRSPLKINQGTAVAGYKKWFFGCLSQFGKIIPISEKLEDRRLNLLLGKPDAIFVAVNFSLERSLISKIHHRLLWLSLGSLLFSERLYAIKSLPSAQVNIVSTQFQLDRLRSCLGSLMPETMVFSNKIDTNYYTIPEKQQRLMARKRQGIKEGQLHIIYAGRWIVTKGICQLIRVLDIWPLPSNAVLTLVGNIEEGFGLAFSFAHHKTFSHFLNEEILQNKSRAWLHFQETQDKEGLRDLFWSADLFVNLSTQPDEDFGVTPRQAMACGLPVVTTNFCGLRPLAESMPWKGVDTYPTLFGSRFSLRQFRVLLQKAITQRNLLSPQQYRNFIRKECNPQILKENLKRAVRYLINRPTETALDIKNIRHQIKKQLLSSIDSRIFKYFIETRKELSGGAYVYGDGPTHYAFPIVQGIYSARSVLPKVEKNSKWRGFFRIALWDKEQALIELGFPGPRIRRYPKRLWDSLVKCAHYLKPDEYVIIPKDKDQLTIVQELVDLGYLVPEDY